MYAQFFGNYLLSRSIVTTEQLIMAIKKLSTEHLKLGTLAIYAGYMSANDVDKLSAILHDEDKRFGELAIEQGYLSEAEVLHLLRSQSPDFLLIGQIFVDEGIISYQDLENLLVEYQSDNEMIDLDISDEHKENMEQLIKNYFLSTEQAISSSSIDYVSLFFNNLIRFVGDDFTPLPPMPTEEYPICYCVSQQIRGSYSIKLYFDLDEETAIGFASRYAGDTYTEFDDYVKAAMEDFINLHNGLYNVNLSNDESIELELDPPTVETKELLIFEDPSSTLLLPIIYPFGTMHFLIIFQKVS